MSGSGEHDTSGFSLLAFCQHNGETESLTVTKEMSYAMILSCLQEKGISLSGRMMLHYDHPVEHFPVSIRNDDDVVHMVRVHEVLKKRICKMSVNSDEPPCSRKTTINGVVDQGTSRYFIYYCCLANVLKFMVLYAEVYGDVC